ncbi:restriction endonuclease subunit S [Spirillospora sp. NPDC049024]
MTLSERAFGDAIRPSPKRISVSADEEYRIAGIYSFGRGLIKRPTITGAQTAYSTFTRLETDQLVMSKLNAWEGALAVVPDEFSGAHVSPEYPAFDINRDVADPAYIKHLVAWPTLWDRLTPRGSMVRRKRTTPATLMATPVPLPDLKEQRRIAARLDALLMKFEQVVTLRAYRSELCEALGESLIWDAVKSAKTTKAVGEVITLIRRPIAPQSGKTYREIGIKSFGKGVFHKEPVSSDDIGSKKVFAIEPGDLLFSNVFAWEGAVALASAAEAGFIGSHRFMTYQVNEDLADPSYLRHYFTCKPGLEVIRRASPGSAGRNKTLGIKKFEAQQIPLPPLDTQHRMARTLDAITTGVKANIQAEAIAAVKPSLLNKAFSGQL